MKLRTKITRRRLYAIVRLFEGEHEVAYTTMRPDVQARDIEVENFKRAHRHQPLLREESK